MEIDTFPLLESENEIIGISTYHSKKDNLLVTIQGQGVYKYNVITQQCSGSWLFQPETSFCHPVLLFNRQLITVHEFKWLWVWEKKKEVKTAKMTKLRQNIFKVLTSDSFADEFIIVFESGDLCVASTSSVILMESNRVTSDTPPTVHWADLFPSPQSNTVLLTLLKKQDDQWFFDVLTLSTKEPFIISFSTTHKVGVKTPSVSTCAFDPDTCTLSLLSANEVLLVYKVPSLDHLYLKDSLQLIFRRRLDCFDIEEPIGSTYIQSGQLVLIGNFKTKIQPPETPTPASTPNSGSTAKPSSSASLSPANTATSSERPTTPKPALTKSNSSFLTNINPILLLLWDTNNGIVQGKHILEDRNPGTVVRNVIHSVDHHKVQIAFNNSIMICPIHSSPPTLAQAVARDAFHLTKSILHPQDFFLIDPNHQNFNLKSILLNRNSSSHVIPKEEWDKAIKKKQNSSSSSYNEVVYLKKLVSLDITPDYDAFNLVFEQFMNLPEIKKQKFLSKTFGKKVGARCMADFFWAPLKKLLISKALAYNSLPGLIDILKEHEQLELIVLVLIHIDDIPPRDIVGSISYFVSKVRRKNLENVFKKMLNNSELEPLDYILNHIISYPTNHILIQPWIVKLTQKEVIVLIEYLSQWMQTYTEKGIDMIANIWSSRIPTPHNILTWCNLIVDSHLSMIVLVDEINELFIKLKSKVQSYIDHLEIMAQIQGCIEHFSLQHSVPGGEGLNPTEKLASLSDYYIERFQWTDTAQINLHNLPVSSAGEKKRRSERKKRMLKRRLLAEEEEQAENTKKTTGNTTTRNTAGGGVARKKIKRASVKKQQNRSTEGKAKKK